MNLAQALGIAAATLVTFGHPIARDYALASYANAQAEIAAETAALYAEAAFTRAAIDLKSRVVGAIEPIDLSTPVEPLDPEDACESAAAPWL